MKTSFATTIFSAALLIGCASHRAPVAAIYPYHQPLASPGAKFGGLPPAVQNTVRAEAGAAEIDDIDRSALDDRVVYTVFFHDTRLFPPLYVESDGSVLYPDKTTIAVPAWHDTIGPVSGGPVNGIKFSDLPIQVAKTIQEKAPTAEVAYINKLYSNGNVFYEVSFKNPARNPRMIIAENGTSIEWGSR